jgi:hypothetical protein
MRQVVALLALVTAAAAGCTAGPTPGSAPSRHTPSPTLQGYVRPCASSVYGELGPVTARHDVIAGPLAFIGLNNYARLAPSQLRANGGKYFALKVLAVVKQGWQITVSVPGSQRGDAALLYDPDAMPSGPPYAFSAGEPAVTFPNCGGTQGSWDAGTQFNGGLLVRGPMCVDLDIAAVSDATRLTWKIAASVGRGASCL